MRSAPNDPFEIVGRYTRRTEQFSGLMEHRVREILLVAAEYDAFVLEEEGQLAELVSHEYRALDMNPGFAPHFTRVEQGSQALELLAQSEYDLVVTTARLADIDLAAFGRQVKASHPGIPVGVLAAHAWDLPRLDGLREAGAADWVFLWQGDVRPLLAMIKQVEDRRNADHDVREGGVQAIVLVEDDVRFYSFFLPRLYEEVVQQTSQLMAEGVNLSHRLLRLQARPKVLLAHTFEDAMALCERYAGNLLGVISDLAFPRAGRLDAEAGLELARKLVGPAGQVPVLLMSTETGYQDKAAQVGASFLHKGSPRLLEETRQYILESYGFGDFVFRRPGGAVVGKAKDLHELLDRLANVPDDSIEYHANNNHFSRWLKARTEFDLALDIRPIQVSQFPSVAALRAFLIQSIAKYLRDVQRYVITDFHVERFDDFVAFAKVGSGSLGGKGRGLAFMLKLLSQHEVAEGDMETVVPQTVVLASDVFEEFLDGNGLRRIVAEAKRLGDAEVLAAFRRGRFERQRRAELARFLETVSEPIAVRSSSTLEDSLYQPFAGVYATVVLPNSHASLDVRLAQLIEAIKGVYASTYMKAARDYLENTPYRLEEERMAVLLQRLVGRARGGRFYPLIAGVASSYNFYPFGELRPEDGVAQIALGLGKSVVEGLESFRFCPAAPEVVPEHSAIKDILRHAQRRFYALDMTRDDVIPGLPVDANLVAVDVAEALADSTASPVVSTFVSADDAIHPGVRAGGIPLVTFAPVLRGTQALLPKLLSRLLAMAQRGMGVPVEMEFAVDAPARGEPMTFYLLQVRPMVVGPTSKGTLLDDEASLEDAVVYSKRALGHGRSASISDLVVVRPDCDRGKTAEIAAALEQINQHLREAGRSYLLIGPGRWGSRDPWLGIPVVWSQISKARAIVETDFQDFEVTPSQGSHFFHNLTSFGVAFLSVRQGDGGHIDWDWIASQPSAHEDVDGSVRHIHLDRPVRVLVEGRTGRGVVAPEQAHA
jgi:DNA-binding response OmpR family regulator